MQRRLAPLLTALVLAAAGFVASAQTVDFFYDKANWEPAFEAVFADAPTPINHAPYADTSTYQAAVRSALRSRQAPGLFTWWSGYRMKDLVDAGLVADLTSVWQPYLDAGTYSSSLASAFTFDGKIYGIPSLVAYWVVFYNQDVFDRYGLEPPTSWEELETVATTLVENDVTPFGQTVDGRWPAFIYFQELLVRQDPDFYARLMEGEASYTDPEVAEVFATWQDWIDRGFLTDPTLSFGTAGTNAMASEFAKGNVAMILVGNWYADTIAETGMSTDQFGVFIMPNRDPSMPNSVIYEAGPILVAENSAQKDAALADADYWMSAQAQQIWVDEQTFPPVNSETSSSSELIGGLVERINGGDYQQINRFWEATPPEIAEAAVDELARFMLQQASAEEVMQNLQTIADQYWSNQ